MSKKKYYECKHCGIILISTRDDGPEICLCDKPDFKQIKNPVRKKRAKKKIT